MVPVRFRRGLYWRDVNPPGVDPVPRPGRRLGFLRDLRWFDCDNVVVDGCLVLLVEDVRYGVGCRQQPDIAWEDELRGGGEGDCAKAQVSSTVFAE